MKYRKLQIVWSVVCGIVCVLLVALWIDSYYHIDHSLSFPFPGFRLVTLQQWFGDVHADAYWDETTPGAYQGKPIDLVFSVGYSFTVPYWSVVAIAATVTAVPWIHRIRWRFSLRTLLIAATLVAVVLGLLVYALRR
jgi:hypothetical protein